MVIVIGCAGGVNEYAEAYGRGRKDPADELESLDCVFCIKAHRVWRHGWQGRWASEGDIDERIDLRRLYRSKTGRTVLLFPDFLVPRKQATARTIALYFLHCVVLSTRPKECEARDCPCLSVYRQKARAWREGAERMLDRLEAYVARIFRRLRWPRGLEVDRLRRTWAMILGKGDPVDCFRRHGRQFYALTQAPFL